MDNERTAWAAALNFLSRVLAEHHPNDVKNMVEYLQAAKDATWKAARAGLDEVVEVDDEATFDESTDSNWCGREVAMDHGATVFNNDD